MTIRYVFTVMLLLTSHPVVALSTTKNNSNKWPVLARGAFTAAECDSIVELYSSQLERVHDTREYDNVSRINRFDVQKKLQERGDLDWILQRVAKKLPLDKKNMLEGTPRIQTADELAKAIDFSLLHEFNPGMFFGLHVDTKPNDGTFRTYNINVMCSDPAAYKGGELQVGESVVEGLQKGDLYMYPASFPHAVKELESGLRYTYILALHVPVEQEDLRRGYLESYWKATEERFAGLSGKMGEDQSKLHLIHAQFLEADQRPDREIDLQYCNAYKSTPQAKQYADTFYQDGLRALQAEQGQLAENYFFMAACIDPSNEAAQKAAGNKGKAFGVTQSPEL